MAISNVISVLLLLLVLINLSNQNIKGIDAFHQIYEELQSESVESVNHLHRPSFHFQPPKHWINGTFDLSLSSKFSWKYLFLLVFNDFGFGVSFYFSCEMKVDSTLRSYLHCPIRDLQILQILFFVGYSLCDTTINTTSSPI